MSSQAGIARVEESLRIQSMVMTLVRVFRTVLTIGIPIVLVRVLEQDAFGAYKQVTLVSTVAVTILGLGLPPSLFYFLPRLPERSQSFIQQTLMVFALASALGGLALALSPGLLDRFFGTEAAKYSLWLGLIVALSVTSLLDVLMVVDRRVRLAAASSAALDATHGVLVISAAVLTRDLNVVLAVVCLSLLVRVIVLFTYVRWRARVVAIEHAQEGGWSLGEQFRYALPFYCATMVAMCRDQLHAFFVATQYDATQFAIYAVGTIQLPLVGHMMQSVGETIILENTKNYAAGHLGEMRRVWHRATYFVALVMLPLFCILEFFASDIIAIVFGEQYTASASVWRVFVIMLPLSIFLGATMLRATGDLKRMIAADMISLVATVATLLLLMDTLGVLAAVWSIVVGNATLTAIVTLRVRKRLNVSLGDYLQWGRIFSVAAVALLASLTAYYATLSLPLWIRIVLGPGLAGVLYLAGIWFTRLLPDSERALLISLKQRMMSRFDRN